jgi:GMP synthase-like glutamine amidotransferase
MPNCLVVQHVAPEPATAIADALVQESIDLDIRRVFAGDPIPTAASGFDGLVVMGGPMSAASDRGFPTRGAEVGLIADAIRAGIPTLGVCLGAQLLAVAGGAPVRAGGSGPEIGWGPVTLTAEAHGDPLFAGLPDTLTVLHWHADTFDIPAGGRRLAANVPYPNQAFRLGDSAWGVQFHLEVDSEGVDQFLSAFGADADAVPGGAAGIRAGTEAGLASMAGPSSLMFGRFARLVAAGVPNTELVDMG